MRGFFFHLFRERDKVNCKTGVGFSSCDLFKSKFENQNLKLVGFGDRSDTTGQNVGKLSISLYSVGLPNEASNIYVGVSNEFIKEKYS